MDKDDVKNIFCPVKQSNYNTHLVPNVVVAQPQHINSASKPPITHLAEKRLSTDFCDWSEVTEGLLWETWRQQDTKRGRVSQGKQREVRECIFFTLISFPS